MTAGCGSPTARWCPMSRSRRPPRRSRPRTIRKAATTSTSPDLPLDFQWLRTPYPERIFSLGERPGFLRLIGRESVGSFFEQALVARRQQHFSFRAETELEFSPDTFQQAAGLTLYYNRHKFHFLAVTHDARLGRVLTVMSCLGDWPDGRLTFPLSAPIPLADGPGRPCRRGRRRGVALQLPHRRGVGAGRAGARRQHRLRRSAVAASTAPLPAPSSACWRSTPAARETGRFRLLLLPPGMKRAGMPPASSVRSVAYMPVFCAIQSL